MGRIVTDPATGKRYRSCGPVRLDATHQHFKARAELRFLFKGSVRHPSSISVLALRQATVLEPLPRVGDHPDDPEWPGSFPEQYLRRGSGIEAREGDVWLVYQPLLDSWRLGGMASRGVGRQAWLLRRADVTHDWDHEEETS